MPGDQPTCNSDLNWYRQVLDRDPISPLFVELAERLYRLHQWEEAVEVCRRGLVLHPLHLRARVLLGLSLWRLGKIDEALEELEKAREELGRNAEIFEALAEIYEAWGWREVAAEMRDLFQKLAPAERGAESVEEAPPLETAPQEAPAHHSPALAEVSPAPGSEDRIATFLAALLDRWASRSAPEREPPRLFDSEQRRCIAALLKKRKP
jgi:tetratricopeptide (TPR) repeat protein